MEKRSIGQQFQKAKLYRLAAIMTWILIILPMGLKGTRYENFGLLVCFFMICLGFYYSLKYRCPKCHEIIDIRIPPSKISYCPYCKGLIEETDNAEA